RGHEVQVVADRRPGLGPLAGIEAALLSAATPFVFVFGGDMPSVSGPVIDRMGSRAREGRLLGPRRGGRPRPLHPPYPVTCLPLVSRALDQGELTPRDLFAHAPVDYLSDEDLQDLPGFERSFDNINTPDDLVRAERIPWVAP